jgi:hypothetical protein
VILTVSTPSYGQVVVDASDGRRYTADLSPFASVHCFPDPEEWPRVSIDSLGLGLVWSTRFEVHVDQVIGLATRVDRTDQDHAAAR